MKQRLTVHNQWEHISYKWLGAPIDPNEIESIHLYGYTEPIPVKVISRTEHYNDMGNPCTATSDRLYVYVELLDDWYEVTDRMAKKVVSISVH